MTDDSIPIPPEDDEILAAEHALGVTDVAARAVAETRRIKDRAFDNAILAWEARLQPLVNQIAPVEPSAKVWPRIEKRISPRQGFFARPGFWRFTTVASLAAAAACLVIAVVPTKPPTPAVAPEPPPILTSFIQPAPGKTGPIIAAALDPGRQELILTPAVLPIEAGKSAELWVIPAGLAPQSLGVIEAGKARRIPLPAAMAGAGQATAVLAVTIEQMGGSPTGAPMGPVVATGGFMPA